MDLKLTGRSALITGSSKGIGLAIGKWFAREGVNLCLVARSADALEREAREIRSSAQVNVQTMAADLSDPKARRAVFEKFPDVDILINNAGAVPGGTIEDVDEAAWRAGWDLKIFGYVETDEPRPIVRLACQATTEGAVSLVIPPWNGFVGTVTGTDR